ncbi:MAG: TrkH family potassium uptake protein [Candidatus Kapaibacterium sp.]
MRIRIVMRIIGFLLIFLGAALLTPLPFAYYYGGGDHIAFLISAGISVGFGSMAFLGSGKGEDIRPKEGFAVVALGWIFLSLFGSLPYLISGSIPSPTDAFFETMSGFTTTGATILTDIEALPHGILFWRSLTHWLGGMGIILLSLAILPFLGVGGMQLFKAEVPGPIADKLKPRVTETAKILWGVYVLISAVETALLMFGGMNLFEALCHTFGTMATGGFSTKNASLGGYQSAYFDYVVTFFMILAGTNFALHYRAIRGDFKSYFRNKEFLFYISLIGIAVLIIGIDTYTNVYGNFAESLQYTLFQVVAIITTTGYGTADYEQWSLTSQLILFALMFIGGSAGSTGGGMKVLRVFLLIKFVKSEIVRLLHPQAVVPTRIGRNVVDQRTMANVAGFFVLYVIITAVSTLVVSAVGLDLATSLGVVAATINNIGPGLGLVGPTDNYAFLPDGIKWLSSFLMLIGRLEVFTVIILFSRTYWAK